MEKTKNIFTKLNLSAISLGSLPIISIAFIYSFVLHTRFILGEWPKQGSVFDYQTYKGLLLFHDKVATFFFVVVCYISFVAWLFPIYDTIVNKKESTFRSLFIDSGFGIWWALYIIDPSDFICWFLNCWFFS